MARTQVSTVYSREARFSNSVVHFRSDLETAGSHSLGRDRRVGQVMCYLSLIRGAGLIDHTAIVSCIAAARQHFKSSRSEGKQAAHYLPGQLKINNKFPWLLLSDRQTAIKLEALFGDVEDLPANFNKADSAAEAYRSVSGLKTAFAKSCKIVVESTLPGQAGKVNRAAVNHGFKDWIARSKTAYLEALHKKEAKVNVPELKRGTGLDHGMIESAHLSRRESAIHRDRHYLDQICFLKEYLAIARPITLNETQVYTIERRFRP